MRKNKLNAKPLSRKVFSLCLRVSAFLIFNFAFRKRVFKNSSLVTHNAVSHCSIVAYSANSPYTTRHPTHHQNHCILLRIWILHTHFTPHSLVTIKKVTSESALQLILYQNDMPYNGDEWVTSETKWITAVILWCTYCYSDMGDELTSNVKILFFFL